MGPLVAQDIISSEWNFVIALLIGIGFGFVLEQAGFSSSKKLAGVFYGYDFVVLRVFFTAAITAMVGLIFLNYLGLIDMSLVYINPTYLYSTIVGGAIMGVGFILGGFCPGTGVCAAAIGKIDAWFFLLGIFIGIFFFAEAYDLFHDLYLGLSDPAAFQEGTRNIKVYDQIGISGNLFAFGMIIMALVAFIVTAQIEKKVKKPNY
ncbi:MAG: YeeE/YedE family protein [Bacteroidales bacterium]|nr:YeeE/YedE family protein [Bacteroidales bacterium]